MSGVAWHLKHTLVRFDTFRAMAALDVSCSRAREYEFASTASLLTGYMRSHTDINPLMRAILIDWLVSVAKTTHSGWFTLNRAVLLIDRFLAEFVVNAPPGSLETTEASAATCCRRWSGPGVQTRAATRRAEAIRCLVLTTRSPRTTTPYTPPLARANLQLVGVAALLIAAKLEVVYPPLLQDLVHFTDRAYTCENLRDMERTMLVWLGWHIWTPPSATDLLRSLPQSLFAGTDHWWFMQYLLVRCAQEYRMLAYRPVALVASAWCIAHPAPWDSAMEALLGSPRAHVESGSCTEVMRQCVRADAAAASELCGEDVPEGMGPAPRLRDVVKAFASKFGGMASFRARLLTAAA